MRIWYRTGIALPAGVLRQLIPGHQSRGETSGQELVDLMRIFGLSPVSVSVARDAIQERLAGSLAAQTPPIVLGFWDDPTTLHWVLGVAASASALVVNDPWGGVRRIIPWPVLLREYAGTCIL